ncbi:hypothetical protein [Streptomyces sp. CBMA156]|uniref:hypothetical protein n=1 Tax=Streptomyces sp. CBMA156 TaxID=1930280 RepID=UPI001661B07B|nr:hypothetical protein [Streptomyces sp. CBMA156]MBD0672747.1 hypothetical protein [Streptomyces sp. CBMA156]MBD0673745.1 hypothetical protein [Streptomyces sp. CBMA156]
MTHALPPDVAGMLDALLHADDPDHQALRAQLPHLRIQERCGCGCGTASLELEPDTTTTVTATATATAPAGPAKAVIAAEAELTGQDGQCAGGVLLFTHGGRLSLLEVYSWTDDKVTLAQARQMLPRPAPADDHTPRSPD